MTLSNAEKRHIQRMENSIAATPTPEQIEAALREYQNPKYDAADDETIVKGVLTAAAGVGDTSYDEVSPEQIKRMNEHAAGVGGPNDIFTQVNANLRAKEIATIERCAKAVWDAGGDNVEFHCAAIRALKSESKP